MGLIEEEYALAESMALEYITDSEERTGRRLLKLSRKNVARAEMMIANDSRYRSVEDEANKFHELGNVLLGRASCDEGTYHADISEIVELIDKRNSTHLNADGVGRTELTNRICDFGRENLLECLRDPKET